MILKKGLNTSSGSIITITDKPQVEMQGKGYRWVDRATANYINILVKLGMKEYSSRMERLLCKSIEYYTSTDDDMVFYNNENNSILCAEALYQKNYIIEYDITTLK